MLGRIMATFVAAFVSPFQMSALSIVTTLTAACLLFAVGHISSLGLYVGSGLVGMAISWQFGSIYSWTAMKMDITGKLAFLFSGGCGFGGVVLVPLVNLLIQISNSVSAMVSAILMLAIIQVRCAFLTCVHPLHSGLFPRRREFMNLLLTNARSVFYLVSKFKPFQVLLFVSAIFAGKLEPAKIILTHELPGKNQAV